MGDDSPYVYFSSAKLMLPRFDLQHRTSAEAALGATVLELGGKRMNPERLALGLGSYGKWLAAAAVIVVGALVLLLVPKRWMGRAS